MHNSSSPRRRFIKSSAFGLIGITGFGIASAAGNHNHLPPDSLFYRYPSMDDAMVSGIVGASHANIDKVRELLTKRPELANAAWDWGFGDWETALGAASHVGRRDIAELLISYGARPDIYTYAMMGMQPAVQQIIESVPTIQLNRGPHGITLLQHAKNRLGDKNITAEDKANVNKVIAYLEKLGNADNKATSLEMTDEEKQKYTGEYRFGQGEGEVFVVEINPRKILQVSRKGSSPRNLNKIAEHTFSPVGAASVKLIFRVTGDKAASFSVHEPEEAVNAVRV